MKVLLTGKWTGGGGEINFIYKALKKLNIEVDIVRQEEYFNTSLINKISYRLLRTPYYFFTGKLNKELIKRVKSFKPDFILCFKPILIKPKTVKALSGITKVFSWYPDYVLFPKTCSTYFYKSIPLYDCHFFFNFANSKELLKLGAKKAIFLTCAADPDCHKPTEVTPEEKDRLGADIVFIGTYAKENRFEYMEKLCGEGYDIKIYGNSWEKCPKSSCLFKKGCIQFKEASCGNMSKVLNSSKIALAFVREHNDETLACRTFEIPACGAFMLHSRTSKIGEFLEEGKEAEFFDSYDEMKNKIDFYLKHDLLRKNIAKNGQEKIVNGGHLFINRVKSILDIFESMR
ncbi:MAG: glycosyltransferase [Patescibacteria group bacterium]